MTVLDDEPRAAADRPEKARPAFAAAVGPHLAAHVYASMSHPSLHQGKPDKDISLPRQGHAELADNPQAHTLSLPGSVQNDLPLFRSSNHPAAAPSAEVRRCPTCARGAFWWPSLPSTLPSPVGVLGMAWGCVNDPDCAVVIVDHVADASATRDLVLPLFEVTTVVSVHCEISAESVLALVVGAGTRLSAYGLQTSTGVRQS
ncbi:Uncharacterised protein [Mycobacterium tuberculosis]|nr:Uncharacterised protein [Mycobacterium tuberculosis]